MRTHTLASMQCGDKGNTISGPKVVVDGIFKFPINVIDQDEDAGS